MGSMGVTVIEGSDVVGITRRKAMFSDAETFELPQLSAAIASSTQAGLFGTSPVVVTGANKLTVAQAKQVGEADLVLIADGKLPAAARKHLTVDAAYTYNVPNPGQGRRWVGAVCSEFYPDASAVLREFVAARVDDGVLAASAHELLYIGHLLGSDLPDDWEVLLRDIHEDAPAWQWVTSLLAAGSERFDTADVASQAAITILLQKLPAVLCVKQGGQPEGVTPAALAEARRVAGSRSMAQWVELFEQSLQVFDAMRTKGSTEESNRRRLLLLATL